MSFNYRAVFMNSMRDELGKLANDMPTVSKRKIKVHPERAKYDKNKWNKGGKTDAEKKREQNERDMAGDGKIEID